MRGKKRIMTAVIVMAVSLALLAACGNQAAEQAVPPVEDAGDMTADSTAPLLYGEEAAGDGAAAGYEYEDIGIEAVKAIVLERVPGAAEADIYELEWEYEDGWLVYEGSVYYGGYEYEFEIDGATGNILQWEIDD